MLVLTRKSDQKIIIGRKKEIVVTVLKVQGDQVSIGIDAPAHEPIYRKELLEEIEAENAGGALQDESVDVRSLAQNLKLKARSRRFGKSASGKEAQRSADELVSS
jgi:carbon storage regulator